jgi:hypothetical protein
LHAFAAFLYSCIGQADNCHTGHAVSAIYFDFYDDAIEADDSAGEDAG